MRDINNRLRSPQSIDIVFLAPFTAGNFLYIGATDLVPEFKNDENLRGKINYFMLFTTGLAFMLATKFTFEH